MRKHLAKHVLDVVISLAFFVISGIMMCLAVRSETFNYLPTHSKILLRRVLWILALGVLASGATYLLQFIQMFGDHAHAVIVVHSICAVFAVLGALSLLHWQSRKLRTAKTSAEHIRLFYDFSGVTHFEDQSAITLALMGVADMVSVHEAEDLAFLHINAACHAYGYTQGQLRGQRLTALVHEEDVALWDNMLTNMPADMVITCRLRTGFSSFVLVEASCRRGDFEVS
jgi:hypothetical protein